MREQEGRLAERVPRAGGIAQRGNAGDQLCASDHQQQQGESREYPEDHGRLGGLAQELAHPSREEHTAASMRYLCMRFLNLYLLEVTQTAAAYRLHRREWKMERERERVSVGGTLSRGKSKQRT